MSRTYCGKSCAECEFKEELSCPGCQAGPGKRFGGECQLAKCCASKGHETCETCQLLPHCGMNRGKSRIPQDRIRQREDARAREELLARRSPVFGRWLWLLFWLVVPSTIASIMTNDSLGGSIPSVRTPGLVIQALTLLANGLILLRLSKLEEDYKAAAVCILIGAGIGFTTNLICGGREEAWTLLLTIPATIVNLVGKYKEYGAHAAAAAEVDCDLSEKWETLRKWFVIVYIAMIGSLLLAWIPLLAVLVIFASAIGMIVLAIAEMVILYNTAKAFRDHAAYLEMREEQA